MPRTRLLLLAGLLVGLLSATSASYAAAHEFIATKTGTIKGSAVGNQTFEFAAGSGEDVVCKKLSLEGSVTSLKTESQAVAVKYEECEAKTFLGKLSATVSAADYTLDPNGTMTVVKPIEMDISGLATQTVPAQGPLSTITCSVSGMITIDAAVTGIHSTGGFGTQTTGTYNGDLLIEAPSGLTCT